MALGERKGPKWPEKERRGAKKSDESEKRQYCAPCEPELGEIECPRLARIYRKDAE